MEEHERAYKKLRLATCIRKILKEKKTITEENKAKGLDDITHVDTMRQLESSSGLSYTIIQTTASGKRDIQITSLLSLIESLNITFTEFATIYDNLSEKEIKETRKEIESAKKVK